MIFCLVLCLALALVLLFEMVFSTTTIIDKKLVNDYCRLLEQLIQNPNNEFLGIQSSWQRFYSNDPVEQVHKIMGIRIDTRYDIFINKGEIKYRNKTILVEYRKNEYLKYDKLSKGLFEDLMFNLKLYS